VRRIDIETKLHRDRAWLLDAYAALSDDRLHRGLTPSEHDPSNLWSALDHLAHLSLIERNFAAMVRRHIGGHANPVGLSTDAAGVARSFDEIMRTVHAMTEEWQFEHAGKSLAGVVALGQASRADRRTTRRKIARGTVGRRVDRRRAGRQRRPRTHALEVGHRRLRGIRRPALSRSCRVSVTYTR
jgi:hypothetical protein